MKVLRTAFLSAFLIICFINISHAQISFGDVHTILLPAQMHNMSMTISEISDGPFPKTVKVSVEYDVTGPPNSVTKISSEGEIVPVFTQTISGLTHISTEVTVYLRNPESKTYIGCQVCDENNDNCQEEGCTIGLDVED